MAASFRFTASVIVRFIPLQQRECCVTCVHHGHSATQGRFLCRNERTQIAHCCHCRCPLRQTFSWRVTRCVRQVRARSRCPPALRRPDRLRTGRGGHRLLAR